MKIALCKTSFAGPVSGADETLVTYAIALQEAGCDVRTVILYRCPKDDPFYLRLKNAGVPVEFVVRNSLFFKVLSRVRDLLATVFFFVFLIPGVKELLRSAWQSFVVFTTRPRYRSCLGFFRQQQFDILHVFTPDAGATVMIRAGHALGIPMLYHELGTSDYDPALKGYYRRLGRVLPLCNEVAALSPRLATEWSAQYPFLPMISVLPLISEPVRTFNFHTQISANARHTVFGFAARVEHEKGPSLLVEATAMVNKQGPLAVARFAGTGSALTRAKMRARELSLGDACEFVGYYSDPLGRSAFMNSLDVFVLPSFAEGTPNSIIEAMGYGLPVIATRVGGIPDIVDDDCGILIAPGDSAALAEAMLTLSRDRARCAAMGRRSKQRFEQIFSKQAVLPLLLETYSRVTRNGHEFAGYLAERTSHHPWSQVSGNAKHLHNNSAATPRN